MTEHRNTTYQNSPEYIEDEIELTRRRFEARVEALSAQASPDNMVRNVLGARSSDPTETVRALVDSARANPISALLLGAGVAGLLFGKNARDMREEDRMQSEVGNLPVAADPAQRVADHARGLMGRADQAGEATGDAVTTAKATLSSAASRVQDKATGAASAVSETLGDAAEAAGEYADDAYRSVVGGYKRARNEAAHRARSLPDDTRETVSDATEWVKDNPIPVGLMALAAGAALASFMTTTRRESLPKHAPEPRMPINPEPETHVQAKPLKTAPARKTTSKARSSASNSAQPAAKRSVKPRATATKPKVPNLSEGAESAVQRSTSVLGSKPKS